MSLDITFMLLFIDTHCLLPHMMPMPSERCYNHVMPRRAMPFCHFATLLLRDDTLSITPCAMPPMPQCRAAAAARHVDATCRHAAADMPVVMRQDGALDERCQFLQYRQVIGHYHVILPQQLSFNR